ncbi:MAG: 4-hydroxy-3-methylbut-2-en-1-yl diphosphate synthase [Pedobacter sp.]|nr:MAG: 4-hydroxy-3-methylbut-2-en-1-yl diphosphate synthase [Pedobacter sp.]
MEKELKNHILQGEYCANLFQYNRLLTREINIGGSLMGGYNPIRIQSMTTTDTMDTQATVAQTIRLVESGCDYVRITAPSLKEAENLGLIKKELRARGYNVPLIADIHFTPNAAEMAARLIEKVRVNPGNYADKKKFENLNYTASDYAAELERIYQKFSPLVKICKEYGTAMRIGTNHGSLSDRIMSHYGDTPRGMVESAMEFIRICEDLNFYNLCISMKASNTQVMVEAYRLLVKTMHNEGMNYPLHLGVTEAGDGEDGRIKSAVGIGTLLADGLGDTIRVSLTEDPEFEAPVAKALADRYESLSQNKIKTVAPSISNPFQYYSPYQFSRRVSQEVLNIGSKHVPVVVYPLHADSLVDPHVLAPAGYNYQSLLDKFNISDMACDYIYFGDQIPSFNCPGGLGQIYNYNTWKRLAVKKQCFPLMQISELHSADPAAFAQAYFVTGNEGDWESLDWSILNEFAILVVSTTYEPNVQWQRSFALNLMQQGINCPIIWQRSYEDVEDEALGIKAAADFGSLLTDGLGDGIWIGADNLKAKSKLTSLAFGILQATRLRISKTEYISCPSCGRTLFDLQETTQYIRSRTDHLKGIKIAIMGCIVNGPGEMADADYGYVGTGPGKITLYRGKTVVKKNVDSTFALDELIHIIQEDGNWIETT